MVFNRTHSALNYLVSSSTSQTKRCICFHAQYTDTNPKAKEATCRGSLVGRTQTRCCPRLICDGQAMTTVTVDLLCTDEDEATEWDQCKVPHHTTPFAATNIYRLDMICPYLHWIQPQIRPLLRPNCTPHGWLQPLHYLRASIMAHWLNSSSQKVMLSGLAKGILYKVCKRQSFSRWQIMIIFDSDGCGWLRMDDD